MNYPYPRADLDNMSGAILWFRNPHSKPHRKSDLVWLRLSRNIRRLDCQRPAADMEIALWEGNLNSILLKDPADHEIELAPEHPRRGDELTCPDTQGEVQRALTEFFKQHIGFWLPQDSRMGFSDFQKQSPDRFGIGAVGHADGNREPDVSIRIAPVNDTAGDEIRVRHDDRDVVVGHHRRRTRRDFDDVTMDLSDFDSIADFDRTLKEQDNAADQVVGNVLKPEPDSNSECAGKNRQRAEINAGRLQDNDKPDGDNDVPDEGTDRVSDPDVYAAVRKEFGDDPGPKLGRDDKQQNREHKEVDQRAERDDRLAAGIERDVPDSRTMCGNDPDTLHGHVQGVVTIYSIGLCSSTQEERTRAYQNCVFFRQPTSGLPACFNLRVAGQSQGRTGLKVHK